MAEQKTQRETTQDKHERHLRRLILNDFEPIYIGDRVKVSERWAGDSANPHEGKTGRVTDIEGGMQAAFNADYLIYSVATEDGDGFETYHYTLDRTHQPEGNRLLEKVLRETNQEFWDKRK